MRQQIVFSPDARRRLVEGMSVPVRAIAAAYGPSGRGAIIHCPPAAPEILYHGLAIAREFQPSGTVEYQGSRILYETMYDLDRDIGDGSSSLALITHGLLVRCLPLIQAGYAPSHLAEALFDAGKSIHQVLQNVCDPFVEERHAVAVCHSAAGRSPEVAKEVASIMRRLGPDGHVSVKEGYGLETRTTVYPGMSLPAGLVSQAIRTSQGGETELYSDPYLLLCDENIEDFGDLVSILEGFAHNKKSLVILCRGIAGTALTTLILNVRKAGLKAAAIAVPEVGERVFEVLEDIAALTGGQVVSQRLGRSLQTLRPEMLGRAERVEVSEEKCILISRRPDPHRLERRIRYIRNQIERTRYLAYDREKLQERVARLSGGIAEVCVGAHSAPEQKLKMLQYQKALHAYQSARRSSVVPGGGSTHAWLAAQLEQYPALGINKAANIILVRALRQPRQHLIRTVYSAPDLASEGMESPAKGSLRVFDVRKRAWLSTDKAGILDSSEVVFEAIKRSISVAATVLKSEVCICKRQVSPT